MRTQFWNPQFHVEPERSWLNDPNGLCQFNGRFHAYYQYAPDWPESDLKHWGHLASDDLITWESLGSVLAPDSAADMSGVWSGSAWIDRGGASDGGDLMYVFYTGNVIDHSVCTRVDVGREANQILTTSEDGTHFSPKRVLLTNVDYPASCTLHVRDPKVWEQDGMLHMLLGARQRGPLRTDDPNERGDYGSVLVYDSTDTGNTWQLRHTIIPKATEGIHPSFGYMWECPNIVRTGGREFLAVCPQGLPSEPFRWHNLWQAGYFPLSKGERIIDVTSVDVDGFHEWDHGFDYYAPQVFENNQGRSICIGWMGTFDPRLEYTPEGMDRCHTLTLPRTLSSSADGCLCQWPVRELEGYRSEPLPLEAGHDMHMDGLAADIVLASLNGSDGELWLNGSLCVFRDQGSFGVRFAQNDEVRSVAGGRTTRRIRLRELRSLRVIVDASTVEVYANDGREVLSTRWFPHENALHLCSSLGRQGGQVYPLVRR